MAGDILGTTSSLLINEPPLMVQKTLAVLVGLNEGMILQQVHYWLGKSNHNHDGRKWIYNTYDGWQEQFPFWSKNTIIRAIKKLEEKGLLLTGNYNKLAIDKTKWYSIDYDALNSLILEQDKSNDHLPKMSSSTEQAENTDVATTTQNEYMDNSPKNDDKKVMSSPSTQNEQSHLPNLSTPLPEITHRLTTTDDDDIYISAGEQKNQSIDEQGTSLPKINHSKIGLPKTQSPTIAVTKAFSANHGTSLPKNRDIEQLTAGNETLTKADRLLRFVKTSVTDRFLIIQWLTQNEAYQSYELIESQIHYMLKHTQRESISSFSRFFEEGIKRRYNVVQEDLKQADKYAKFEIPLYSWTN